MKALILVAGYGTRLYPLTKNRPKPLLPVSGQLMIDHILGKLQDIKELKDIILISNNKFYTHFKAWAERSKNTFKKFSIQILNDGSNTPDDRLGAVGDLAFVLKKEKIKEDILIVGGDNIFDFSLDKFASFANKKRPNISLGLYDIDDINKASRFGVVKIRKDKKVVSFEEKPKSPKSSLIAMCLYYFPSRSLKYISEYIKGGNNVDAPGRYIKWLSENKAVYGFVFKGKWHDIGHLDYYNRIKDSF